MPSWWNKFTWEWLFDNIAARSPTFVKVMIVTGKSFLYYHGMTRAAALTYTTLVAVVPLLIILTSITFAVGFGGYAFSDYLPMLFDILDLDWPTEPFMDIVKNAEHIPLGKLGFIGAIGLFVTFILAFGSLETNFNVIWENKTSRTLIRQIKLYTPFLLIGAIVIGMFAGFVSHVQGVLSKIIVDGLHFSPALLKTMITAFWYSAFHSALLLSIFLMLFALPSRPERHKSYAKKKLFCASLLSTVISWLAINIYVKILMFIQTAMVTRMSIFYGSLAFIPLFLFLLFGIWSIILCGNSLVWTICHWPEAGKKVWNWKAKPDEL